MSPLHLALWAALGAARVTNVTAPDCWPSWLDPAELETLLAAEPVDEAQVALRIVDCRAQGSEVEIEARLAPGTDLVRERVALGDVAPSLRLRTLALAIAELLATSPLRAASPGAVDPTVDRAESADHDGGGPTLELGLGGSVRLWTVDRGLQWGLRGTGSLELGGPWFVEAELNAEWGRAEAQLGQVERGLVSTGVGGGLQWRRSRLGLAVGPRLEVGWVWARGEGAATDVSTQTVGGPLFAPGLAARARYSLSPALALSASVAGGHGFGGVEARADGDRVARSGGPFVRVSLALRARIPGRR